MPLKFGSVQYVDTGEEFLYRKWRHHMIRRSNGDFKNTFLSRDGHVTAGSVQRAVAL
jgi:hypothetical protein